MATESESEVLSWWFLQHSILSVHCPRAREGLRHRSRGVQLPTAPRLLLTGNQRGMFDVHHLVPVGIVPAGAGVTQLLGCEMHVLRGGGWLPQASGRVNVKLCGGCFSIQHPCHHQSNGSTANTSQGKISSPPSPCGSYCSCRWARGKLRRAMQAISLNLPTDAT